MGKIYQGVGSLTGRRLKFDASSPYLMVDDDSKPIPDRKDRSGMTNIVAIIGREVLDSRGNPTVEAEVQVREWSGGTGHCAQRRIHRRA